MDWTQLYNMSCNSSFTVSEVSYENSGISLVIDYKEDLEKRNCSFIISYDTKYIGSQGSTISFTVESSNEELIYEN